ncbi:MAG: hypothetical protein QXY40_06970 [Candidatus Methanomethylicia archaeon]
MFSAAAADDVLPGITLTKDLRFRETLRFVREVIYFVRLGWL